MLTFYREPDRRRHRDAKLTIDTTKTGSDAAMTTHAGGVRCLSGRPVVYGLDMAVRLAGTRPVDALVLSFDPASVRRRQTGLFGFDHDPPLSHYSGTAHER